MSALHDPWLDLQQRVLCLDLKHSCDCNGFVARHWGEATDADGDLVVPSVVFRCRLCRQVTRAAHKHYLYASRHPTNGLTFGVERGWVSQEGTHACSQQVLATGLCERCAESARHCLPLLGAISRPDYVPRLQATVRPVSTVLRRGQIHGKWLALFDLDHTLIRTTSRKKPTGATDWEWWSDRVVPMLQALHREQRVQVVVCTNQKRLLQASKSKELADFQQKMLAIEAALGVPLAWFVATEEDRFRKPGTGMWELLKTEVGPECPDPGTVTFVGDAAGREADPVTGRSADFDDFDRKFAEAVGLRFLTPEEFFAVTPQCLAAQKKAGNGAGISRGADE